MNTVTLQSLRVSPEVLAKILACSHAPATDVLAEYVGAPLSVQFSERYDRDLTRRESRLLRSAGPGHVRQGWLVTPDGDAVAEISAVLLASRIPAGARGQLGIPLPGRPLPEPSALPLGPVLARFGITRWPLGAEAENGVVRSSAMLMRGKSGAGLVTEVIPCAVRLYCARTLHLRKGVRDVQARTAAPALSRRGELVMWRKSSYSKANGNCTEVAAWRTSTHSGPNGSCVELRDGVQVRDSQDKNGPVLAYSPAAWTAFLSSIREQRSVTA